MYKEITYKSDLTLEKAQICSSLINKFFNGPLPKAKVEPCDNNYAVIIEYRYNTLSDILDHIDYSVGKSLEAIHLSTYYQRKWLAKTMEKCND